MAFPKSLRPTAALSRYTAAWSRLGPLLGGKRGSIVVLAIGSVLSGITEAGVLAVLAQVAAALVNGASHVRIDAGPLHVEETIGGLLVIGFALALARLALQALVSVLPAKIAAGMQAGVRRDLFAAFSRASWDQQSRDREGQLQEMATNQAAQAAQGALQAMVLIVALLTFLALVVSALALNVIAALIVLVTAVGLFVLLRPLNGMGSRSAQALSRAYIDYAGGINEAVRVAEETKVFGVDRAQREQVNGRVANVRDLFFRTQLLVRLGPSLYQSLVYVLVMVALAGLYLSGASQVASLGAVVLLLVRAGAYGQQAQGAYQSLRQALPYLDRLQEARRRYVASTPVKGEQRLDEVRTLAFDDVCFEYEPDRPVLSDIAFEIVGGEAIGIVGPSGAGKSTMVQILLGLRAPTSGCYRVNGLPVEDLAQEDWHRLVAYVPQEPHLLHASVLDNIRFFRDLDEAAVERAARLAGIHDDIVKWPHGYETVVGPRADAVSGGQQQRISLARALAAQPELLVLDEPTSALDPHSELLIQESLATLKHELTLFVVAHRMSTLEICERVMVVVDGRLEALDTASRLRSSNDYYRSASAVAAGPLPAGSSGQPAARLP